jgi:steroid delta-isomerase-like uncharacterized protein
MIRMIHAYRGHVVARELDEALVMVADDILDHAATPGQPPGKEGGRQLFLSFYSAFPDFMIVVDEATAEGDKVAVRATFSGTHKGSFQGLQPTGKYFSTNGIEVFRVENGLFTERWFWFDTVNLMTQLGLMPGMGS